MSIPEKSHFDGLNLTAKEVKILRRRFGLEEEQEEKTPEQAIIGTDDEEEQEEETTPERAIIGPDDEDGSGGSGAPASPTALDPSNRKTNHHT